MKFWKGNKIDQEYEASKEKICEGFLKSKQCEAERLDYYGLHYSIVGYITDNEGMASSFDIENEAVRDELQDVYEHTKSVMKQRGIWFKKQSTG